MQPRKIREIQSYSKLDGARVLRKALRTMHHPIISRILRRKSLITVLTPFRAVRAPTFELLEKKIKIASKGKKCGRVFIRGDPVRDITRFRSACLCRAPRGHLDMKTGKISWDPFATTGKKMKDYNFLLYATRPRNQIEREGRLILDVGAKNVVGVLSFGMKEISFSLGFREGQPFFEKERIRGLGALDKPLCHFIKALIKQRQHWNTATLRFVKWEERKGIEFFDFQRTM